MLTNVCAFVKLSAKLSAQGVFVSMVSENRRFSGCFCAVGKSALYGSIKIVIALLLVVCEPLGSDAAFFLALALRFRLALLITVFYDIITCYIVYITGIGYLLADRHMIFAGGSAYDIAGGSAYDIAGGSVYDIAGGSV